MIYEFVGFPAYEAAVESEIGLLGVLPVDASNELGIRLGRIYKLVRKGSYGFSEGHAMTVL